MAVVIGVWFAVAGGVAALAGLSGRRRERRLRRSGLSAPGMVLPSRVTADEPPGGRARRFLIQYSLADGRVIERTWSQPMRIAAPLRAGQHVLVRYDPADPGDFLVRSGEGRYSDRAFMAAGMLFILIGAGIAAFSH
jgi:Protein of unknown function (DUF3592)